MLQTQDERLTETAARLFELLTQPRPSDTLQKAIAARLAFSIAQLFEEISCVAIALGEAR